MLLDRLGKSCSEIKYYSPQATNGSYAIDPDGEGGNAPFTVFCDMTAKNAVGVTIIGHESQARIHVNWKDDKGRYVRPINYLGEGITSISQIAGLADISTHCEQFIKFECHHARLPLSGSSYGWWVSRDFVKMTYWGGATPADLYKCACGVNNACADPSYGCNCDKNDQKLREDSGLLTEKSHLPVAQLKFGDTGSVIEKGYHTLAKFKCYGKA